MRSTQGTYVAKPRAIGRCLSYERSSFPVGLVADVERDARLRCQHHSRLGDVRLQRAGSPRDRRTWDLGACRLRQRCRRRTCVVCGHAAFLEPRECPRPLRRLIHTGQPTPTCQRLLWLWPNVVLTGAQAVGQEKVSVSVGRRLAVESWRDQNHRASLPELRIATVTVVPTNGSSAEVSSVVL